MCQPARSKMQHGVRPDRDGGGDFVEMKLHRLGVGVRKRQRRADAAGGTNGAEQIGALVTLIGGLARARSPSRPLPHEAVLLADPRLILEPNLDRRSFPQVRQMDFQNFGEVYGMARPSFRRRRVAGGSEEE